MLYLRFFTKDNNELKGNSDTVKCFSENIGTYFGLDKCVEVTLKKGRIAETQLIHLEFVTKFRKMSKKPINT